MKFDEIPLPGNGSTQNSNYGAPEISIRNAKKNILLNELQSLLQKNQTRVTIVLVHRGFRDMFSRHKNEKYQRDRSGFLR